MIQLSTAFSNIRHHFIQYALANAVSYQYDETTDESEAYDSEENESSSETTKIVEPKSQEKEWGGEPQAESLEQSSESLRIRAPRRLV